MGRKRQDQISANRSRKILKSITILKTKAIKVIPGGIKDGKWRGFEVYK